MNVLPRVAFPLPASYTRLEGIFLEAERTERPSGKGVSIGWSLKIGRLLGAEIRVHWLFLALFVIVGLRDLIRQESIGRVLGLAALGVIFLSVFLHELGHVWTGLRAGGKARQILMWPLGGMAEIEGVPPFPGPQIRVSAMGPAVNLVLSLLCLGLLALAGLSPFRWHGFGPYLLQVGFLGNAVLFAFNLVPLFPLDGADVLRWTLIARDADRGYAASTLTVVKVGKAAAVLLGIAGIVLFLAGEKVPPWISENGILLLLFAVVGYLFCEREKRLLEYGALASVLDGEERYAAEAFTPKPAPEPGWLDRRRIRRIQKKREKEVRRQVEVRKRVDFLLDKIAKEGITALSERERAFLRDASKHYQKDEAPK